MSKLQAGSGIEANMHLLGAKEPGKAIDSNRELEFAVYCIENVANALGNNRRRNKAGITLFSQSPWRYYLSSKLPYIDGSGYA